MAPYAVTSPPTAPRVRCTRPESRHPTQNFQFDTVKLHNDSDVRIHAAALVEWQRKYVTVYNGPSLAVWGSDFQFTEAETWFMQMDQVIAEINDHPERYGNATAQYV